MNVVEQIANSDLYKHTGVTTRVRMKDHLYREIDLPMTVYRWDRPREFHEWKITRAESTRYLTTTLEVFPNGARLLLYRTIGKQEQFTLGCMTEIGKDHLRDRAASPDITWEDRRSRDFICNYAMVGANTSWILEKLHERNKEILETENLAEQPVKWYVKLDKNLERPGLRGFGTLPVKLVPELWMREMDPKKLNIVGAAHSQIRFSIMYEEVLAERITISWPNLIFIADTDLNYPALAWVKTNCIGNIIPFSALPSMFMEPVDEVMYDRWFEDHTIE